MDLTITEFPIGARPNVPQPDIKIYKLLGEKGIRKLVSDHYNLLVESKIKEMFPPKGEVLEIAKKHSADFFIQRLEGPDYYTQNRGKPMLTRRHEPFSITQTARKEWLLCYQQLLPKLDVPEALIVSYWKFLDVFSIWMVNTAEIDKDLSSL
jgi:hemoglobin